MSDVRIESSSFEEILPFWHDHLWPQRKSPIEPCSAIHPDGHISMDIMKAHPVFFKAVKEDQICGVVSGFATSSEYYRSRGLWVHPDFRNQGMGCALIEYVAKVAANGGYKQIWSMPRHTTLQFYLKNGFRAYNQTKAYEFGPHYFVKKLLIQP